MFRQIQRTASMVRNPSPRQRVGARTIPRRGFCREDHFTTENEKPPPARPAPTRPPTRACEEDEGIPKYQVIRFQAMAPMSAPSTTSFVATAGWRVSAIMEATPTPTTKTAKKLKKAAQSTAYLGERTRVETMVAMAFAESWNPLMKSKMRATATMRTIAVSCVVSGSRFMGSPSDLLPSPAVTIEADR